MLKWIICSIVLAAIFGYLIKRNKRLTKRAMEEKPKYPDGFNLKYWR